MRGQKYKQKVKMQKNCFIYIKIVTQKVEHTGENGMIFIGHQTPPLSYMLRKWLKHVVLKLL